MKKLLLKLLAISAVLFAMFQISAFADTEIMTEDFNDGKSPIKLASNDSSLDADIINADTGDEAYGKVFKTLASSTKEWYFDLGKTFTNENANIAKISFDIKAPMVANKNVMFYFADSAQVATKGYDVYNSNYRKKAMYFRANGNMGVNTDTASGGSWYTSVSGSTQAYTAGQWYHIDITVDLHKQTATYMLDGKPWATATYGAGGAFTSFDIMGVKVESTNKTGYWYIDNIKVSDATVKVDKSVLFAADFEKATSAADAGLEFSYGGANSAVETGYGDEYGNVLRFTATETTTSRFKVPVNALNPANKSVSMSFDLYAEEADKAYCMIYLYDANGKDYKILVRNSNQAAGKTGYFKFLNIGAPWQPTDCVSSPAKSWVHIDGIFEFRDNQTVIKWYFDGKYAGVTYSFALKNISYIRFNVNKTETADVSKVYAIDNILMRQYENNSFITDYELTGDGAGEILTITPSARLANDFAVADCDFKVTNSVTGKDVAITSKAYTDGKIVLTLDGLENSGIYNVSSTNFTDMFGKKMAEFEFMAKPQYDTDNCAIPEVSAVWLYDYDGNRLTVDEVTTEVNQIKIMFNTAMDGDSVKNGVTFGGLTLNGSYSADDNSYTADWDGYLEPDTTYELKVTGAKSRQGKNLDEYNDSVVTEDGMVSIKSVEILNSAGEAATEADITEDAVLTAKVQVLNTTEDSEDAVLAYGIYKNSYMTDHNYIDVNLAKGVLTPVEFEVPYTDIDSVLKIFMWDKISVLNPYYNGFEFSINK